MSEDKTFYQDLLTAGAYLTGISGAFVLAANLTFMENKNVIEETVAKKQGRDPVVVEHTTKLEGYPFILRVYETKRTWNLNEKQVCQKEGNSGVFLIFPFQSAALDCQPFSNFAPEKVHEIEDFYKNNPPKNDLKPVA